MDVLKKVKVTTDAECTGPRFDDYATGYLGKEQKYYQWNVFKVT